jgi:hypothetical protein
MPTLSSEAVDRNQAVARPGDLLQFDPELLVGLKADPVRADHAFMAAIALARVVGQDVVLTDNVGIEEGEIGLAVRFPDLASQTSQKGVKSLDVLLRHCPPSIPRWALSDIRHWSGGLPPWEGRAPWVSLAPCI